VVTQAKRRSLRGQQPRAKATAPRGGREPGASRAAHVAPVDGAIVASTTLLVGLGIVMNYSATAALAIGEPFPPLAVRHIIGVGLALTGGTLAFCMPLSWWRRLALPLWLFSAGLLAATLFIGLEANGARRWLAVPGLRFAVQPAELARFATTLAVAAVLARAVERREVNAGALRRVIVLTGVPTLLLGLQPDFSSDVLLVAVAGLLLFAAGLPFRLLAPPALAAASAGALYLVTHPYAWARVGGFLDPWQHARGGGFQLVQSFVAFGRGGSFGVGLGDGRQKLFFLPEAHTDFILSVVAEELGLVGVLVILGSFAAFAIAGMRVAGRAKQPFALLAAFGMTGLVALPALVNAAVVMGVLPTTGLTLPFLSHGSNSLCCAALAVGILLRIAAREAVSQPTRVAGATPRGLVRA